MSDDVRRKLLLKYLGNIDDLNDDNQDENDTPNNISPLKSFTKLNATDENFALEDKSLPNFFPEDLPSWKEYFDFNNIFVNKKRNIKINFYYKLPLKMDSLSIPIFILHHGAGSSALTFATLARDIFIKLEGRCAIMAFDARGHGKTEPLAPKTQLEYNLNDFTDDFTSLIEAFNRNYLQDITEEKKSFILVGHSLGGSICTFAYSKLIPNIQKQIVGITMLDIVEEAAIFALDNVQDFLHRTPSMFNSFDEAIRWSVKNNMPQSKESAEISVPALFRMTKNGKVARLSNLQDFKKFWNTWFVNLSHEFVSLPTCKLLILAGNDNLDKQLIVGQMQGKYQLVVFQDSGHFIQEDASVKTAITLIEFWKRNDNKTVVIKSNWGVKS
ncbi:hypothetical protein TPHA_0E01080 [Tetrapisispora phaffii CBS 4417]|uniref:Protein phosphatase methylesterase 1 n=1 Tax=Tetrapisispora phaffii (strain ATCC 24235 / CBS 4417 / NBRC 1672 / NRRL Y-8282 / UCD 70-5) TaxID=1071381 RepID=G8BTH4_TETPH|nr:carboxylesterase-mitochondrial 37S ribosomal protein YmS2 TPHA_0E01080 [Tetrapisispora phaffii CBS 4417]CCE63202.1 hypothetical protein TPHA_0E01080 [Tetrapisispora phaffii CBS 4417]